MSFMTYNNNIHLQFDFIACNYQSTIGSYIVLVYLCTPIFQAEGASTEQALSSALTSIMDALKSTDWNTRKAASLALSSIAVSSGYLVTSFRTSCLRSLERSKFDKVLYLFTPYGIYVVTYFLYVLLT